MRSERRMSSEWRKPGLGIFLAIVASLLLARFCAGPEPPPPPAPEPRSEVDWRIEVAQEGLSQALANLTDMELEEAKEVVRIVERETKKYNDEDPMRILAFIVAESRGNIGPRAELEPEG